MFQRLLGLKDKLLKGNFIKFLRRNGETQQRKVVSKGQTDLYTHLLMTGRAQSYPKEETCSGLNVRSLTSIEYPLHILFCVKFELILTKCLQDILWDLIGNKYNI